MRLERRWLAESFAALCFGAMLAGCGDDGAGKVSSTTVATDTAAATTASTQIPPTATATAQPQPLRTVTWKDHDYLVEGRTVTAKAGRFTDSSSPGDRIDFTVGDVFYGDLTGDTLEEAVVLTFANYGGTGTFSTATVYGWVSGKETVIGFVPGGDRGDGNFQSVAIAAGTVLVKRFQVGPGGSLATPKQVRSEVWSYSGGKMVEDQSKRVVSALP